MVSREISKWFRGIATLMVIASHYAGWMFVEPKHPQLREQVMTLGVYGVDIFFLLSGYGLVKAASKSGVDKRFVRNRFAGSYLPYILVVGTIMLLDGDLKGAKDVVEFALGLDYWFMSNLFVFYLLFMVCYKTGTARNLLLGIGVVCYSVCLSSYGYADFWIVSNAAFLAGVYWAECENINRDFFEKLRNQIVLFAGSFLGMWYCYRRYRAGGELLWESMTSVFFALFVAAVCLFAARLEKKAGEYRLLRILFSGKVMGTLGQYSLFIYLMHTRLFYLIIFKLGDNGYFINTVITGCITIIAAVVTGRAVTEGIAAPGRVRARRKAH